MFELRLSIILLLGLWSCQQPHSTRLTIPELSGEVKTYRNKPSIHINGNPEAPILYALTDVPGGRWSWEEVPQHNISQFCKQGIQLYQLDLFLEQVWPARDSFNIALAQKQVKGVLEVCPEAAIFFRFHVNAPRWWMEDYPEETVLYDSILPSPELSIGLSRVLEADARNPIRASLASKAWLSASSEKLIQFCQSFSRTREGNALVGIQVACGIYGEWHQWGFGHHEADFSKPMQDYFRNWLKNKYPTDEDLQVAWANPKVRLDSANIPTTPERSTQSAGLFRDPEKDQKVIDYYLCQHELVAEDIIHFSKVVKNAWPRPIITGTFYGYFFSVFNRQAAGGHLALHKVLESEYVDYLSGPQVYYPEEGYKPGEPYRSRSLIHSIYVHGKLWLDEYDQQPRRTWPFLSTYDNRERYKIRSRANVAMIKRNMMFPLLKGQGLWLYDFGPSAMHLNKTNEKNPQAGTGGYWDNPIYMDAIGQIKQFADRFLHEEYESAADVLAVYDTRSILYMPSTKENPCPITEEIINKSTLALYYSGVLFDPIHLKDLNKVNLDQYKVVIFFNTFLLNETDKALIQEKVAQSGKHLVWMYAPGITNGNTINGDFISGITRIQLDTFNFIGIPSIKLDRKFLDIPDQKAKAAITPLFYINDSKSITLGQYKGSNKTGFGYKKLEEFTSWYIGIPVVDAAVFRMICEQGGANIYSGERDIVYGGGHWLMIHSTHEGIKKIKRGEENYQISFDSVPATKIMSLQSGENI